MSRLGIAFNLFIVCCFVVYGRAKGADSITPPTSARKPATASEKSAHKSAKAAPKKAKKKQRSECCGCSKKYCGDYGSSPQCDCIQFLLQDYPGTNDLYICLTFYNDCSESGEMNYWFGQPADPIDRPEACSETTQSQCEPSQAYHHEVALLGHGLSLDADSAWNLVHGALQAARNKENHMTWGSPQYHTFRSMPVGVGRLADVTVLAVPIYVNLQGSKLDGKTIYMCMQIDSAASDKIVAVDDVTPTGGHGAQFRVTYKAAGETTERSGLVWLK